MSYSTRLYLDVHALQTVPVSCINRDDTGSPKTATYGGVTRSRVSSQSWKRAIRVMFKDLLPEEKLGVRTKKIVDMIAEEIQRRGAADDPQAAAQKILEAAGLKIKSVEKGTDALFFLSRSQAGALAQLAAQEPELLKGSLSREDKKKIARALSDHPAIDVALFGRMVADDPSLNTDASAQVAHSLSTHKVSNEYDYFTAVDDLTMEDSTGASHIGTMEFNSSTMYRYATVAVHQLAEQLAEDTVQAAVQFVRAFVCSMPTGRQNSCANRTLPDAVLVTLRNDQPINLVGAYEKPVPASDEGYVAPSARRLVRHARNVYGQFAGEPVLSLVTGEFLSELGDTMPLSELLDTLARALPEHLPAGRNVL
ncbi:type I-E CRISPR-associated protein Cas7/Cse4/CasC [Paenibacillus ginsengihumi]|uniref:type I-E CRISPR-associated protein Cas7/Cse4/CasC n=1 Tax=Paenibacillus ginsengihumi TaxID=431596 RepID=UPI000363F5B2|nr:type I-E CRISPR-associated protein Cas7/Cse4/CasC [Paenibacillus ginsengihumi]